MEPEKIATEDERRKSTMETKAAAQTLRASSWILGVASVGMFALADVRGVSKVGASSSGQNEGSDMGVESDLRMVLLTVAVLSMAWSGPLTSLAGADRFGMEKFSMIQPFRGGQTFVVMQALGWSLYASCCAFSLLLLINFRATNTFFPGEFVALGVFGFTANALLNLSLDFFDSSLTEQSSNFTFPRVKGGGLKTLAPIIVSLLAFLMLVSVDIGLLSENKVSAVFQLSTILFSSSVLWVHFVCGYLENFFQGYKLFQPFQGGQDFQLLQSIGWTFFGSIFYVYLHADTVQPTAMHGGLSLYGICGFVSVVVLTISLDHFTPLYGTDSSKSLSRKRSMSTLDSESSGSSSVYYASWFLQCLLAYNVMASPTLPYGFEIPPNVSTFCSICGPLLAHLGGFLLLRQKGYRLFQPLEGGVSYILAQAFGWALYGVVLFEYLMSFNAQKRPNLPVEPIGLIASFLLNSSVFVFEGHDEEESEKSESKRHTPSRSVSVENVLRTSDMLGAISFAMSVSIDVLFFLGRSKGVPGLVQRLLEVNMGLWILSKASIYLATFGRHIGMWRPFSAPDLFVMCEAVSWTLFAVAMLANVIILNAFYSREPLLHEFFFGWSSVISLGNLFSHLILRYGAVFLIELEQRKKLDDILLKSNHSENQFATTLLGRRYGFSKFVALGLAHVSLVALSLLDIYKAELEPDTQRLFLVCILVACAGCFLSQAWIGPRYVSGFHAFQPFRGGRQFVLLQSIGWTLFSVSLTLALVCLNVGIRNVTLPGVFAGLGVALYVAQLVVFWSLKFFTIELLHEDAKFDGSVGMLLGTFSLVLFVFTDFAVIKYGLPLDFIQPVIASAWVAACASVPLSAFVVFRRDSSEASSGIGRLLSSVHSPSLLLLGCTLWSFTILLGALLVANSIFNNDYVPAAWAATLAGASNIVSHLMLTLSSVSSTKELLSLVPVALLSSLMMWVFVKFFVWLVLPLLRGFLDYPMHLYALVMKRTKGWISPDGLQALRNVHLERSIRYGPGSKDQLDILQPLDISTTHVSSAKLANECGPVLYCHGGGHLCVTSEILLHSMTPLSRAGLTVYSVEYPLSPESRFPSAVLSLVRAILFVGKYHCSNLECQHRCAKSNVSELSSHECSPECGETREHYKAGFHSLDYLCKHCDSKLGTQSVQLIGDSAGGSLVAMATAILCNPDLFKRTVELGGDEYKDLLEVPLESFPRIRRLVLLYGLLGRQTPVLNQIDGMEEEEKNASFLWRIICHIGISFVFKLYDSVSNGQASELSPFSSLTDLSDKDLANFAEETVLICGASDPLLPSNVVADQVLRRLGHKSTLHVLPGTHAFHGFPVNWMHYLGADWKLNSFPATMIILRFFTGGTLDENALGKLRESEVVIADYSPFLVFPFFFFIVPLITVGGIFHLVR